MVEKIGSSVYEIDVTLDRAQAKLRQFEGNVAASGQRADAALAQGFRGGAGVAPALDKATTSTKRLTAAQAGLGSAVRSSATSMASAVPVAGQFSVVAGSIAATMPQVALGVLAGAAAFQILDSATKRFTGAGIIDQLTGQARAHRLVEIAARAEKEIQQELLLLKREGVKTDPARSIIAAEVIADSNRKLREYNDELARAQSLNAAALRFAPGTNIPLPQQPQVAQLPSQPNFDEEVAKIRELGLTHRQLLEIVAQSPPLLKGLKLDIEAAAEAAGLAQASFDKWSIALDATLAKQAEFAGIMADVDSLSDALNPQILALQREQVELEQLKTKMGDAFGEANQARLDELTRRIGLLQDKQALASLRFAEFGAIVQREFGDYATKAIANVGDALSKLPAEQQLEVKVILPDLAHNIELFQNFINILRRGATVQVAVQFAAMNTFPGKDQTIDVLPGIGSPVTVPGVSPAAQAAIDTYTKAIEDFNNAAQGSLGPIAKNEKATAAAAKMTDIWADGIISWGEAIEEGLNPAQAAQLELTHDAELAVYALANAEFRLAVESNKAASGTDLWRIAMINIQAELIRSERTAEQFNLEEKIRPALEGVADLLNDIFSKPTRESLQFDLQLKKLERQKLLIERRGGDTEAIDARIDALRREIDLRETELEIMQLETQLKDKTLQTDLDLLNANAFLATVISQLSEDAESLSNALGVRVFQAALQAAAALDAVGAAGGTGFTAAEKHWINGVAIGRGEPIPFPGFQRGLPRVPVEAMPVIVHRNEAILTPQQADEWRMGGGLNAQISIYGATDPDAVANKVVRRLADMERIRGYGGATSLPHANTPR